MSTKKGNPWSWIPTLYFAQGIPYVAVMTISVIMYKRLGISNTDIALYTGWLYLPWVIKPFWSPFIDIIRTKRWWVLSMQWLFAIGFAAIAFCIPVPIFFQLTLAVFWLIGFTSATHDIAADGFYMLALTEHQQSLYVGVRSTFYRVATIAGQGLLVVLAGAIELNSGLEPLKLTVNADPDVEWTPTQIFDISATEADLNGELQFITPANEITIASHKPERVEILKNDSSATDISFKEYATMMRDSVKRLNIKNGFIQDEGTKQTATQKTKVGEGAFTRFIREKFGEKRDESTAAVHVNNFAIVGFRLTGKPEEGKEHTIVINQRGGDQSIRLEQDNLPNRFTFNSKNYDKPAYLLFEVDNKLTSPSSAYFEGASGNIPLAWMVVFLSLSVFFLIISLYHTRALPRPEVSHEGAAHKTPGEIIKDFFDTFKSFFTKPQILPAIAFMLLYRLPEAQLVKMINPFLLDPIDRGGLGLTTGEVGLVYGTIGIIGLTIGGIIGGIVAAKGGLKKWLKPMAWSMSLTCLTFVYLSYVSQPSLLTVNVCVFIEQFGYGFGFTAYMLYLIYFSEGKYKTAHYAICTGFMSLGMMLPGMAAGWLQETIGYRHFFIWTMICCIATIGICAFIKVDPSFGQKEKDNTKK